MITWIRPSNTEITTGESDGCLALAAKNGWKRKEEKKVEVKVEEKKSPGPKPKNKAH